MTSLTVKHIVLVGVGDFVPQVIENWLFLYLMLYVIHTVYSVTAPKSDFSTRVGEFCEQCCRFDYCAWGQVASATFFRCASVFLERRLESSEAE